MIDQAKLARWFELTTKMDEIKAEEIALRKELFAGAFPDPTEGSAKNKLPLDDGFILQGDYKINRSVDAAVVSALAKGDNTAPLVGKLIDYKPSLVLKEWKALTDDDLKLVADMVIEKPGTPTLKIVKPKR